MVYLKYTKANRPTINIAGWLAENINSYQERMVLKCQKI